MSLLDRLIGATPEKQEQKGDRLLAAGRWGEAKLAYERALDKLTRQPTGKTGERRRLGGKIDKARDSLAREHRQSAFDMLEGGYRAEAREMLALAIEVSADENLQRKLEGQLQAFDADGRTETIHEQPVRGRDPQASPVALRPEEPDDDYFRTLCHTLPEHIGRAYRQYGDDFKQGYAALNCGHFEAAARHLERALRDAAHPDSHIPLELATAYLHLNRIAEARDLLIAYRRQHPEILPACELLCEIYWDQGEFGQAAEMLANLPPDLATSLAAAALRGETFERAGQLEAARDHYRRILDRHGWDNRLAHRLARVCRDLNDTDEARQLYGQIIASGRSCASHTPSRIRHEYAELCFEDGRHDVALLEIYLALAREAPDQAALYYTRVARIYDRQGHEREARRFRELARQLEAPTAGADREKTAP